MFRHENLAYLSTPSRTNATVSLLELESHFHQLKQLIRASTRPVLDSTLIAVRKIRENLVSLRVYTHFSVEVYHLSCVLALEAGNTSELFKTALAFKSSVAPNLTADINAENAVKISEICSLLSLHQFGAFIKNEPAAMDLVLERVSSRTLLRAYMEGNIDRFWKIYNAELNGHEKRMVEHTCLSYIKDHFLKITIKAFMQLPVARLNSLQIAGPADPGDIVYFRKK